MKFILFHTILLTFVYLNWAQADINELFARGTSLLLQAKTQVAALRHRATEIETAEKAVAVLVAETGILDPDLVVDAQRLREIQSSLLTQVNNLEKVLNASAFNTTSSVNSTSVNTTST